MKSHQELVAARAQHCCEYCRAPEAVFNFPFEIEHVIPLCRDGTHSASNLALSCRSCNLRKAVHVDHLDPLTGSKVRLFHPREDSWWEHFDVDLESGLVIGRTAIGRATVDRLEMNSPTQRTARRLWSQLGLFP